jgi:hypothetical protein
MMLVSWGTCLVAAPYAVVALGFLGALFTVTFVYPCVVFAVLMISQICLSHRSQTGRMCRNLAEVGQLGLGRCVLPPSPLLDPHLQPLEGEG